MEEVRTWDFYLNSAMKGLVYSFIVIIILFLGFFLISLQLYSVKDLLYVMVHSQFNSIDWFSILEGFILFIALPIIFAIKRDLKVLKKSS
jgi:hypothetical protein